MTAVAVKALADIRRRRLQTAVIALVALLSALAATMAGNLLVETDAPYDHAFALANGPHLAVTFDGAAATAAELAATAHAPGVTQAVGPWPDTVADIQFMGSAGGRGPVTGPAAISLSAVVVGRDRPDTAVDRLTLVSGRWAQRADEIVLSRSLAAQTQTSLGDSVAFPGAAGRPSLKVTGIAASISPAADAWTLPAAIPALLSPTKSGPPQAQPRWLMEYRVSAPGTGADLALALRHITQPLSPNAVLGSTSWLDVKKAADLTAAVMVPFLVAFSALALLAAAFVISNVIAGVVVADRRQVGIMKSVGFTPNQVTAVLVIEVLVPVLAGSVIGIPLGTAASRPFLEQTAQALGLPAVFTASILVGLGVLGLVLLIALAAAAWPAGRAGAMSPVNAISRGTGPSSAAGAGFVTALSRFPIAAATRLGLAELGGRPVRSAMTGAAVLVGVSTVVFAIGLNLSLAMVAQRLIRDREVQVVVNSSPEHSSQQVEALLNAAPGTARFAAEGQAKVLVPGVAAPIPYFGYQGDSSWLGYAMISGRWFNSPGEVVAPSHLVDVSGLRVGQAFTASISGRPVPLQLVGEVFDQAGDDLLLRGGWSAVAGADPKAVLDRFEVQLRPGVDASRYASGLQASGGYSLDVRTVENSGTQTAFILINGVVAGLALVLTGIAAAGVLNTVVLGTRERRREIAILKAVGMAPRQVVTMVISSVLVVGLVAGLVAVPVGLGLHHQILGTMGEIATNTRVPASIYGVLSLPALAGLALGGMLIAVVGAWLPARWAAREGVSAVLQAE